VDTAGCIDGDRMWGIHRVSGSRRLSASEKPPSAADSQVADTEPLHPESGIYEVFGPAVTVADMGYFDGDSEPQVDGGRESFPRRERLHTLAG